MIFKLISLNVRGLNDPNLAKKKTNLFLNSHTDVLFFQETKLTKNFSLPYFQCFFSISEHASAGVGMAIAPSIQIISQEIVNNRFMYVITDKYILVNLYAPNDPQLKVAFFNDIRSRVHDLKNDYNEHVLIIAGDFNTCLSNLDHLNQRTFNSDTPDKAALIDLIDSLQVTDIWRSLNADKISFTFSNRVSASRIDLFLVDNSLMASSALSCSIDEKSASDHNSVSLSVKEKTKTDFTKSIWKMNNSILTNENYLIETFNFISKYILIRQSITPTALWWDHLKIKIKKLTIHHSSMIKKEKTIFTIGTQIFDFELMEKKF